MQNNQVEMEHKQESMADNEWDNIVCLPLIDATSNNSIRNDEFESFEQEIHSLDLDQLKHFYDSWELDLEFNRGHRNSSFILLRIIRFLFRIPPPLNDRLLKEKNRIFSIAGQAFDHKNKFHSQCLFTIYTKLTGNVMNGQRKFGSHWEEIGFQGSDPSTDFRGVGILGLLQLTFFVITRSTQRLAKDIHTLSADERQFFPFAITGINLTQMSLQMLRDNLLNRYIIQLDSVLEALNRFYFGIFHRFYQVWKEGNKNIMDTGYVLKDIKKYSRKNVCKIMKNEFGLPARSDQAEDDYGNNFTNIGNAN